jgi:hypothetical protein
VTIRDGDDGRQYSFEHLTEDSDKTFIVAGCAQ